MPSSSLVEIGFEIEVEVGVGVGVEVGVEVEATFTTFTGGWFSMDRPTHQTTDIWDYNRSALPGLKNMVQLFKRNFQEKIY